MKVLFLFSGSFPFSDAGENTFLPQELDQYCDAFDKVVLIPISSKGDIFNYTNTNLELDEDYSKILLNSKKKYLLLLKSIFDLDLLKEIFNYRFIFFIKNPKRLINIIGSNYVFYKSKKILKKILTKYDKELSYKCIMTYWFDLTTTSIARLDVCSDSFVTRAHGYDLYEFRSPYLFFPFRKKAFKHLDYIFTASFHGAEYLKSRYSNFESKISQASLGMYDPMVRNKINESNVFKIVSCSFLQPVKRLDLIFKSLELLDKRGKFKIEWTHIGNGPLFNFFNFLLSRFKGTYVKIWFKNFINQEDLYKLYNNNSFDLFLNVSESEGRPVSIMESLACGIPVLATNVGGNPEIVNDKVGYLIDVNLTAEMLADKLEEIYFNRFELFEKRKSTYNYWNSNFNALNTYKLSIDKMMNII